MNIAILYHGAHSLALFSVRRLKRLIFSGGIPLPSQRLQPEADHGNFAKQPAHLIGDDARSPAEDEPTA
jgi:hypothetical protein